MPTAAAVRLVWTAPVSIFEPSPLSRSLSPFATSHWRWIPSRETVRVPVSELSHWYSE